MNWRIKNVIKGIKNLIFFFPVIWRYQWWDYNYSLEIFKRSLEQYPKKYTEYGLEVNSDLNPKIEKMKRVIELLDIEIDGNHIELIEKEMGFEYLDDVGEEKHSEMHHRIMEFEEETWNELWNIIKGTNTDGTSRFLQRLSVDEDEKEDPIDYINDGSDMRSWWD